MRAVALAASLLVACNSPKPSPPAATSSSATPSSATIGKAEVGKAAPDFALKEAAKKHTKTGVVWLAINSGAAGKQGAGVEANRGGAKTFSMDHPILLDDTGDVGRTYGATNTPHMMVIDDKGTLVYRGAIDNSPDGEGESPTGGKLVSYVDEALAAISSGKQPSTTETKAYGCSVKYASK